MTPTTHPLMTQLKDGVIVSVQASTGEPLDDPAIIGALAQSVVNGGAVGLRLANPDNVAYCKKNIQPSVPIIGITKPDTIPENAHELVYITPTLADVSSLADAGADIVALDATHRERPNGETLETIVSETRAKHPNLLLMADISTLKEGEATETLGFDCVSTTLSGYTTGTQAKSESGPDFQLLETLVGRLNIPVILEGRVWKPWEVTHAIETGAHAVVIGSAITRPHHITQRFCQALPIPSTK